MAARMGPEPRLTRATPRACSSSIEGDPGPARIFSGHRTSATSLLIVSTSPRPSLNTHPAQAASEAVALGANSSKRNPRARDVRGAELVGLQGIGWPRLAPLPV